MTSSKRQLNPIQTVREIVEVLDISTGTVFKCPEAAGSVMKLDK